MAIALFVPGVRIVERLRMMVSLLLIASLYLAAQLVSLWGSNPWFALALFAAATYLLIALVVHARAGMKQLSFALGRIADGEIAIQGRSAAPIAGSSESAALWDTLEQTRANLSQIVTQVRASAETIATGSREMSDGTAHLSQRTEEQASTLEQTASGMEQLASTVERNAEHCESASGLAQSAHAIAERGARSVHLAVESMSGIEQTSKRMADITAVIEGIAFQTNILALNAAVEAARAGDQGRGFAVVASEVRALSQRSAEAAKQIKALISKSGEQITEGSRNAAAAGGGMDEILVSVKQVNQLLGEVALASKEQSAGVGEVNKAILQLESVTQQNAALVEQAAASALHFQEEAVRLLDVVGAFKLDRMEARDQAVALVKKAAAYLSAHGPQTAFRAFQDPKAGFMFGDYYLFVLDMNCVSRAHATDPSTCGTDHSDNVDADGKKHSLEMVKVARTRGRGWVDYRKLNRTTGRIEPKSTYLERVGEYLIGCGIYRPEADHEAARAQPKLGAGGVAAKKAISLRP